jgi:hypothetical protein
VLLILAELVEAQRDGRCLLVDALADASRCGHGEVREMLENWNRRGWWLAAKRVTGCWRDPPAGFPWRKSGAFLRGMPPAGACLPFGAGSRVDAQWRNLLISLDAATAIPLSALESGAMCLV